MPDRLDPVIQSFLANTAQYSEAVERAAEVAERFARASNEATDAVDRMQEALNDFSAVKATAEMEVLAKATRAAGRAAAKMAADTSAAGAAAAAAGAATNAAAGQQAEASAKVAAADDLQKEIKDGLARMDVTLAASSRAVTGGYASQAKAAAVLAGANKLLSASQNDVAGSAARSGVGVRLFGVGMRLTGNAIHWIVAGLVEFLAVAIPAAAAAGAFGMVVLQAAHDGARHMTALWQATEATSNIFHKTMGQALGMGNALQKAQDAIEPGVYQILGAAITASTGRMRTFWQMGTAVTHMVEEFSARVSVDLTGAFGGRLADLLSHGAADLAMFGQILGNTGHALVNFAADMPGLAEVLLRVADAVSRVILWVSSLPRWLIFSVMAMEEFWRWGGLLAKILGGIARLLPALGPLIMTGLVNVLMTAGKIMGGVVQIAAVLVRGIGMLVGVFARMIPLAEGASAAILGFSASMDAAAANMALMAGVAIAVAALAILVIALSRVKDATDKWISSSNKAVVAASNMAVLGTIAHTVAENSVRMADAQKKLAGDMSHSAQVTGVASRYMGQYSGNTERAAQDVSNLAQQHQHLAATSHTVLANAMYLAAEYHTSFAGALMLATQAGVNLQKSLLGDSMAAQIARRQVADFTAGLRAMGQPAGAIGADMSALAVQSGLAGSQVQKVTQALDQFMQMVTGGTSGFAELITSMRTLGDSGATATNRLRAGTSSVTSASGQLKTSLRGLGTSALNTWQQFGQAVSGPGQQLIDWLDTAGAVGKITGAHLTQDIKDIVAQFLPLAKGSRAATAELSAMAQEAGGPVTSNFKTLQDWVGIKGPAAARNLNKSVKATTIGMSDLGSVAQNLGTVILQGLYTQMGQIAAGTSGEAKAMQTLIRTLMNTGSTTQQVSKATDGARAALQKMGLQQGQINQILQTARDRFSGAAAAANGMAGSQASLAARIADSVGALRQLEHWINSLHGKSINIATTFHDTYVQSGGRRVHRHAKGTDSAARGVAMLGEEGPELVFMRGGEQVFNARDTRHLLALAGHVNKMTGYAAGTGGSQRIMDQIARELASLVGKIMSATSPAGIRQVVGNLISSIQQAASQGDISHGRARSLTGWLEHDNHRLAALAAERAHILARIHSAEQFAQQTAQNIDSYGSLSSIMGGAGTGPVSSQFLLTSMRLDLAQIRKFGADITKLEKLGLDRALIKQIIAMGPGQGDQVAEALINGPFANIRALNQTETGIEKASKQIGLNAANFVYHLSGLRHLERSIGALMRKIAEDMVRTLDRELGLHTHLGGHHARHHPHHHPHHGGAGHAAVLAASAAGGMPSGVTLNLTLKLPPPGEWRASQQKHTLQYARRNSSNGLTLTVR